MTWTLEKTSSTQITIAVQVPYIELEPLLAKAAEKLSNEIEIEGFRKGKAPYEVIKQKFGEFKILEEAARMYIEQNFTAVLEEVEKKEYDGKSFEPVGEPNVSITKLAPGSELEYKITLFILPPVELADYKAIAKKIIAGKKVVEVTDKEAETSKDWLRESRSKTITVNRGAEMGDRVEIDYLAKHGGVKLEGFESKNHPLVLGKSRFIPGFDEKIVGMKSGEERVFELTVPGDYHAKNIASKNLQFTAKMNLVQERDVPEWNDEFVKTLGNFASAGEVEKNIRDGLKAEKEEREKERVRMATIEAIADAVKAEIPDILIERELDKMIAELNDSIVKMGLKFEEYLGHIKKNQDDLKKEWRNDAVKRVKIALALREIAKRENIAPSEEDVQEAINRTVHHQGLTEDDVKNIDREAFINYNRGVARNEKVFRFLESL